MATRAGLMWAAGKRKFNLLSILTSEQRASIKIAKKEFEKEYKKDETEKSKHIKLFNEACDEHHRVIEEAERQFMILVELSKHEVQTNVIVLKDVLLAVRADILDIQKLEKLENVPAFKKLDEEMESIFKEHIDKWFGTVESHRSFVMQMSDILSRRQEISHILDVFNIQKSERALEKTAARAKGKAKKKDKSTKDMEDEKRSLDKLKAVLADFLKKVDDAEFQLVRLMLEENELNRKLLSECLEKLKATKFDLAVPKRFQALKEEADAAQAKIEKQFIEARDTLNSMKIFAETRH